MRTYTRAFAPGGTFFFTVNLADRSTSLLTDHIEALRDSVRRVREAHLFYIVAMVVLPEHLHAIWTLPDGDADYPMRWALIKAGFSRRLAKVERINPSRVGWARLCAHADVNRVGRRKSRLPTLRARN